MPSKCWCGNERLGNYSDEYYKCDVCHSLVSKQDFDESITQIVDEETDLYGKNFWEKKMLEFSGMTSLDELIDMYLKDRGVYWLKYLLKYNLPNTSVAEIGCGLGQFPYLVKQSGYIQEAFELSKYICDYASKELFINITNDNISKSKNNFDTILAIDLLEHIYDPNNFINEINEKLKSDGILCFQTPCYDDKLSYEEMLKFKPKFKNLLIPNVHIYIFSKSSIKYLLNGKGFNYLNFEPAFFGDDYDMFVFASRNPLSINTNKEIEEALNRLQNGRIIKALISLFDEKKEVTKKLNIIEDDALKRMSSIETLTSQLELSEKDRADRLVVINNQNIIIRKTEEELEAGKEKIEKLNEEKENLLQRYYELENKFSNSIMNHNNISNKRTCLNYLFKILSRIKSHK